ncbi:unnamed protein product [Effrenium voratum]|uniref:Uncharacterized protein n=1 Tax=Effrenium voratum TaxID=2562239 RepID=A0AA36JAM3_9DINO|nr:unnamed protein product [Effrenium voratum]
MDWAPGMRCMLHMPEVRQHILGCLRRDLQSLASAASSCRALKDDCQPLLFRRLTCGACGCHVIHPKETQRGQRLEDGPALVAQDAETTLLDLRLEPETGLLGCRRLMCKCDRFLGRVLGPSISVIKLCASYLVEIDNDGPVSQRCVMHCSGRAKKPGCGQPLFFRDSVISKDHCWRIPSCGAERAWYINDFITGSVSVGVGTPSRLAQGPMVTADVSCSACNSIIGWKFVSDMQKDQPNIHFVNRYGICCSSFRERPEKCRSRSTASCESSSTGEETEGSFVVTDTVNDPHVNEQGSDTDASSDSDASVFTYVNWA